VLQKERKGSVRTWNIITKEPILKYAKQYFMKNIFSQQYLVPTPEETCSINSNLGFII